MKDCIANGQGCRAKADGSAQSLIAMPISTREANATDEELKGSLRCVKYIVAFIERSLEGNLSLRQVARHAHQSRFHFARAFKRATGMTLHAYVIERRLQRACMLVGEGKHGLSEIALMCGFCSQAHMTTLYKQRFGCTPGQCRMQIAEHEAQVGTVK